MQVRAELSAPVIEKFHAWLTALVSQVLAQSLLSRAVHYTLGHWPKLTTFLTHGEVPLDNNRCENEIRPFVIGRKGWLFSDTVNGAIASANRISVKALYTAISKVRSMSLAEKSALTEEIHKQQLNLLASCLVQQRLGVSERAIELLLNILLMSFQAMKKLGQRWPLISEEEQERQLERLRGAIFFSEDLTDPALAHTARAQYVKNHPEAPLLAMSYASSRCG